MLPAAGMLAHPDSLVIGLNPPFGRAGTLANKFVEHAATHCPRLIVLIVPPRTVVRPRPRQLCHPRCSRVLRRSSRLRKDSHHPRLPTITHLPLNFKP